MTDTHAITRSTQWLASADLRPTRQRVALARAIVREPNVFLMDEPLSNLDAALRVHMRAELAALHRRLQRSFVYVTHDQAEALTLSDRMAVMRGGRILQLGAPDEVYNDPATLDVIDSTIEGFEIQLNGRVTDFWTVQAGYSYLDGEQVNRTGPTHLPEIM